MGSARRWASDIKRNGRLPEITSIQSVRGSCPSQSQYQALTFTSVGPLSRWGMHANGDTCIDLRVNSQKRSSALCVMNRREGRILVD
jgi:hypothetical protein